MDIHTPTQDHARFDAMCAGVEDWERLPELPPPAPEAPMGPDAREGDDSSLDEQILAGLVSPC